MSDAAIPAETVEKVDAPATPPVATPPVTPPAPATPAPTVPPVAPAATPATGAPADTVTLTKEAHDQLQKDSARAAGNQRKANLWDKTQKKGHFPATPPATPPSQEELAASANEEDRKAERGLLAIAADPAYREVFDADPTLRNLITTNPLAVLPMYANDAIDAEDAIVLVKEGLDKLKKPVEPAPATPPVTPKTVTPPVAPPVGAVNPSADAQPDEAYETAKKNPNTEDAVAGMIGAKIKRG